MRKKSWSNYFGITAFVCLLLLPAATVGPIQYNALGQPNGPAQLNSSGKLPVVQLPVGSSVGNIFGPIINWSGTGIPGYQINTGMIFGRGYTTGTDVFDFQVSRDANYTGGTFGYLNSAVRFTTYARAGTNSFELGSISILNNYATSADNSQNVAGAAQANCYGTGGCWAGVSELRDFSTVNPTKPKVSHEFDHRGNGPDLYTNKVVVGAVISKLDSAQAANQVGWGIRIENNSEGASGSYANIAFGVGNTTDSFPVKYVFDASKGIAPTGYSSPVTALRMAPSQIIDFKGDLSRTLSYNPAGALQYNVNGGTVFQVSDGGAAFANAFQLTPDGKAILQFDGSSNTLVYIYNGVRLASWDTSGNMKIKGVLTQNTNP